MPLYTVFAPPPKPGATAPDPLRFVFVKEGFCWPALFIPELWLLFRRMWLVFVLYVAVSLVIGVIGERVGGPLPWVALILMHLLFALEGNALRRWKLTSAGYVFVGVAEGRRDEAEMRFFSRWQSAVPATPPFAGEPPAPAEPTPEPPPEGPEAGAPQPWTRTADTAPAAAPPKAADKPSAPAKDAAESGDVVGLFPTPGGAA